MKEKATLEKRKKKKSTEEKTVPYGHIRHLTESYYALQKMRIESSNRLGAYDRMGLDPDKSKQLHSWIDERLETFEAELKRMLERESKAFPIWEHFLERVKGIGPALSASLVAWIDISKFDNISKLWRYCGQAVIDGRSERRVKGEKIHYSPILKMTCWKIGEQFVKQGDYYREVYDRAKKYLREKYPEKMDSGRKSKKGEIIWNYTDGHVHAMARRKAVKQFLADLWIVWRKLQRLPVTEPYVIGKLRHTTFYKPPESGRI